MVADKGVHDRTDAAPDHSPDSQADTETDRPNDTERERHQDTHDTRPGPPPANRPDGALTALTEDPREGADIPIRQGDSSTEQADHPPPTAHPNSDADTLEGSPAHTAPHPKPEAPHAAKGAAERTELEHQHETPDKPDHEFVEDADPQDMAAYRRIRETDDVDAVAANSGFPREVIKVAKDNLFLRQHDVAVQPGVTRHAYFTPDAIYSDLWDRAASGASMTDKQEAQFWSLVAHEYVEAKLMEAGLPYLSAEPDAWDEYLIPKVTREHPAAHVIAPRSTQSAYKDLLVHWENLRISKGELQVAQDLSNLDEVVRVAKKELGL
ncbi:hypothetical protein [Kribbella hippodromi]|uniref:hypothetical protein n=1 Tax=Kribbella hippodromi TaxID=434347 RepID=UPI0031DA6BAD